MGLRRKDPYLKQWSGMTRKQSRYATQVAVAASTSDLMDHLQTHAVDDLSLTGDTALPFHMRECETCRDRVVALNEHARQLPRHQRSVMKLWAPLAVMDHPELAAVRERGAQLIQTWPDRVDRAANADYEADIVYHLERVEYLHSLAAADPPGPPDPITQAELRTRLHSDLTQLRRERTSAVLLESSSGRFTAAEAQYEPWLRVTVAELGEPRTPAELTDVVTEWRARRIRYIFDGSDATNVTIATTDDGR